MTEVRAYTDDENGRYRAVVEVPGTPEQIWELIATGPGVETWFVPADVEPGPGGRYVTHHGPFGDSDGVITAWEPPHRIAYDEPDWQGPAAPVPTWNTEIIVQAASGDTCLVRLSSGFLAGGDAWRDDIDQTLGGWTGALANLARYLTHFAGLGVTTLLVQQDLPGATSFDVAAAAGLRAGLPGDKVASAPPAPTLSGVLEQLDDDAVVVRTTQPVEGIAQLATMRYGGQTLAVLHWYLYGEHGPAVRDRELPAWSDWLAANT